MCVCVCVCVCARARARARACARVCVTIYFPINNQRWGIYSPTFLWRKLRNKHGCAVPIRTFHRGYEN